jgi:ribonuclease HI
VIHVYTDGSCSAKDRVGGWAFYVPGPPVLEGSGAETDTTISRMELKGIILGLIEIGCKYGPSRVTVFSDSEYAVLGASDRSRSRNVNQDLWGLLDEVVDSHERVEFQHVRGHTGNVGNERVDGMAGAARRELLQSVVR